MATVNEEGKKYNFVAIADDSLDYGMLSETAVSKINEMEKFFENALKDAPIGAETNKEVILMESYSFKLQAVLYHLHNIKNFKENFLSDIKRDLKDKDISGLTCCYLNKELVFEFEALILQARACLDALTVLITKRLPGHEEARLFTKLKKSLEKSTKNEVTESIIGLLNDSKWLYESGILTSDGLSSRNYIAHRGSLLTIQECCMTISGIEDGKLLIFDLEFHKSIPVMNTASKILEHVPYLLINVLSILCGLTPVAKKEFANDLGNEFVILSKETVEPKNGRKVGVIKEMNRVNIIIEDRYIYNDALSKAIQITDIKTN
ncbi:MAG: hypothetical protein PHU34_07350 [Candidatus Methanoperedens sp.]|nr:hypothetical protein [Candidatus Methanoperedens sp.]